MKLTTLRTVSLLLLVITCVLVAAEDNTEEDKPSLEEQVCEWCSTVDEYDAKTAEQIKAECYSSKPFFDACDKAWVLQWV